MNIPHEFAIGGVYVPPILVASAIGMLIALVTTRLLNRFRLSKYFFYPPLVMISMAVIFTMLIGNALIPF